MDEEPNDRRDVCEVEEGGDGGILDAVICSAGEGRGGEEAAEIGRAHV